MIDGDAVLERNAYAVPRQDAEVGGVPEQSAHAARREYGVARKDGGQLARPVVPHERAQTLCLALIEQQIDHRRVRHQADVGQLFDRAQEVQADLLARAVGMKDDARTGMRALARVGKFAALRALEPHAVSDELVNGLARVADHAAHGVGIVLVVARAHGVLKIALLVPLVVQDADAALREEGVALFQPALTDDKRLRLLGQVQGAVHARDTRAHDECIDIFALHCASSNILLRACAAFCASSGATSTGVPSPAKTRSKASGVIFFMSAHTKPGRVG